MKQMYQQNRLQVGLQKPEDRQVTGRGRSEVDYWKRAVGRKGGRKELRRDTRNRKMSGRPMGSHGKSRETNKENNTQLTQEFLSGTRGSTQTWWINKYTPSDYRAALCSHLNDSPGPAVGKAVSEYHQAGSLHPLLVSCIHWYWAAREVKTGTESRIC